MPTPKKPTRTAARIAKLEATLREREERIFALERVCLALKDGAAASHAQYVALREQLAEARALLREWRADFYATALGERLRATERVLRAGVTVEAEPAKEGE